MHVAAFASLLRIDSARAVANILDDFAAHGLRRVDGLLRRIDRLAGGLRAFRLRRGCAGRRTFRRRCSLRRSRQRLCFGINCWFRRHRRLAGVLKSDVAASSFRSGTRCGLRARRCSCRRRFSSRANRRDAAAFRGAHQGMVGADVKISFAVTIGRRRFACSAPCGPIRLMLTRRLPLDRRRRVDIRFHHLHVGDRRRCIRPRCLPRWRRR